MTNTAQDEFLQSLNGEDLTPQQAAQLLQLGEGDTSTKLLETGSEPGASAAAVDGNQPSDAGTNEQNTGVTAEGDGKPAVVDEKDLNATNAVILAKDGKHTISFDKLVEAREGEQFAKQQLQVANQELERLRAEAQQRVDAGEAPTAADKQLAATQAAIDNGTVDLSAFGDFSDEEIAKGIHKLVEQRVSAALAAVDEKLKPIEAKLKPLEEQQVVDAATEHRNAIIAKHPDADSVVESKELADWINSQPSFVRAGYSAVLENGTTQEVIELFDSFKQATGVAQTDVKPEPKPGDVVAAAKAVIDKAKPNVPASLSDIPGGNAGPGTRDEAIADMDGAHMLEAMDRMSPKQIEAFLNRQV